MGVNYANFTPFWATPEAGSIQYEDSMIVVVFL
jgi:hypothetical protein